MSTESVRNDLALKTGLAGDLAVTDEQRTLVKSLLAPDSTPAELELFFYDCRRRGVHPLDRLIHFTKRDGKYVPVTSIHFMRMRADDGGRAGQEEAVYTGKEMAPDYECKITVKKKVDGEKVPYTGTAKWKEFVPAKDFMWRKMPSHMLAKCAEAVALRLAFPRELAGLYVREELEHLDGPETIEAKAGPTMTLKEKLKLQADKAGGSMAVGSLDRTHQGQPPEGPPPSPHEEMLTAAALKVKQMYDRPAMEEQAAPGGALAPILAQADNSGAPRETSGSGPSPDPADDVIAQVGLCETIKEWSGCENEALAIYEQGGFTAAQWARYRGLSDQKKAQFTAKKK